MPYQVTYAEPWGEVVTRNVAGRSAVDAFVLFLQQQGCRVIRVLDYDAKIRAERNNDDPHRRIPARSEPRPLLRAA
jgi:hypothetical protein